ncbi:MAG: phosphatase PAP2 family protein [Firmicutes bacterium]|nr:phosphatase PAP2 family protein [Bacillota bacterium]
MGNVFYFSWEVALQEWLQQALGGSATAVISFFSAFGEEVILIAILGFLYWCWDKEFGKFVGTSVAMGVVFNPMVKNIFLRRRPYFDNPDIKCLRPVDGDADIYDIAAQGFSFPSGHSTNGTAVYGSLAVYKKQKKFWILACVLLFLIGFSRVYVGVHFVTDVLCGWVLGSLIIGLNVLLLRKLGEAKTYGLLLLVSIPGIFYCSSNDYFTGLGLMIGIFGGFLFEKKYVNFKSTRRPVMCVIRLVCGLAIFVGLNAVLKLPFSSEFLSNGSMAAMLVRTARYAVVSFVDIAIYPMAFRFFDKTQADKF